MREEPLIPVGLVLTCYALYGATRSIRRGDKYTTNQYFRARVYAQGFTLLCICVGGVYWKEDRDKRKHYKGLLGEKRAREKREKWIKELEIRDVEEQKEREGRRMRREARNIREMSVGEDSVTKVDGVVDNGPREEGFGQASCPMEGEQIRGLLFRSRILASAMGIWWSGRNR